MNVEPSQIFRGWFFFKKNLLFVHAGGKWVISAFMIYLRGAGRGTGEDGRGRRGAGRGGARSGRGRARTGEDG